MKLFIAVLGLFALGAAALPQSGVGYGSGGMPWSGVVGQQAVMTTPLPSTVSTAGQLFPTNEVGSAWSQQQQPIGSYGNRFVQQQNDQLQQFATIRSGPALYPRTSMYGTVEPVNKFGIDKFDLQQQLPIRQLDQQQFMEQQQQVQPILNTQQYDMSSLLQQPVVKGEIDRIARQVALEKLAKYGLLPGSSSTPSTLPLSSTNFASYNMQAGKSQPIVSFAGSTTNLPIFQSTVYQQLPTQVNALQGSVSQPVTAPIMTNAALVRPSMYARNPALVQQPVIEQAKGQSTAFMQSLYPSATPSTSSSSSSSLSSLSNQQQQSTDTTSMQGNMDNQQTNTN